MPATLGRQLHTPGALILGPQFVILNVLETWETIGNRTHISATLDIILAPQRVDPAAITAHMAGKQGEIDQRANVIHCVVMLGNSQGPADLGARRFGIGMRGLPDDSGRYSGFALGTLQSVLLYALLVSLKPAGGVLNEMPVSQAGCDDLARHGIGKRDIGAHIQAQPHVRPLRRTGAPG